MRGWLYRLAKWMGDLNAVRNNRVGTRLIRRAAGKVTGRQLGRLD